MKQITDIKIDKSTKQLKIYSGEELLMEADPEVVFELGLKKGSTLDEGEFLAAKRKIEEKQAYNASLRYITFKDRTEKEVVDHLKKKEFGKAAIDSAMEKLKKYRFVDDARYTLQFIKDKSKFSDQGIRRIAADLEKRGIPKEQFQHCLEIHCGQDGEMEKAKTLVEKLDRRYEKEPYRSKREKIGRRLMDKGYTWEVVEQALSHVSQDNASSPSYERELEKNLKRILEKNKKKKVDDRTLRVKVAQQLMRKGYSREEVQAAMDRLDPGE